jgi:hypothetical protein
MGRRESTLTNRVLTELNSWPETEAIKKHGSVYSIAGDPDIFGCLRGRTFVLEAKVPGKKPKAIQNYRLRQWKKAGATVGWFDTFDDAIAIVRGMQSEFYEPWAPCSEQPTPEDKS